ncbi:hypothetical protein Nepgr_024320 [Nepenthes gracilis]|uniref:Glycosyl transferase CAP10 domain-containing protein n=1 Tax=Nepenthes gracilis TaxID=150966 RepID=A0AAD3T4E7_NEPGR|nr:hypothetical protein Nepgr_024320 [Nepenthes gracilis]
MYFRKNTHAFGPSVKPTFAGVSFQRLYRPSPEYPLRDEYLLNCTTTNMTLTCPANYLPQGDLAERLSHLQCPDYFRWIHEDLKPWKKNGITLEMVESAKQFAHFRLVIINGTAYVNQYDKAFQTRDVLTLWGILQLLKLYPGRLPDLDLMFQCHDPPLIKKDQYMESNATEVPLLFHFCGSDSTFDIVFPDWSFWGWPETNIKPWVPLMKDIEKGNRKINWTNREPYAYWKGSLFMGTRGKLKNCNSTKDWNAAIYHQDWFRETAEGFNNSDLSQQCTNRYKIYIEGIAWSVSNKYVLACDSMTLQVNPTFYEFFTRSLVPLKHYWPINDHPDQICKSIKFAVEWGNSHIEKAQEVGQEGSKFIMEQMPIENIYDYMFHVLNEYGMLLRYKPTIPSGAVELCSEKWGCGPNGLEHMYRLETMVEGPAQRNPCAMPPPYSPQALQELLDQNAKIKRQVEEWESEGNQ